MMNKKSSIIDIESLLGIDPTWSNKKIQAHLGKEFAKWNGRLNTLPEGEERDNAQQMLNLIANQKNTIKKYKVVDVVTAYYGVIASGVDELTVDVLINKGEKRPCSVTKSYFTIYDNQQSINISITSSMTAETDPNFVHIVYEGDLKLLPGRPAGQEVKVTFSVDDNGVFQASLVVVESGKETEISFSEIAVSKAKSNKIGAFVGIDLGTLYSSISYIDDTGRPQIIRNSEGQESTPSCILFEGDYAIVGHTARISLDQPNVLARFKRDMGTSVKYNINGKDYTPTDCSALILKKLVQDAKKEIGEIGEAVVTTPANFANEARVETLSAAKQAGLEVENIVEEPTAAALYYAFEGGVELNGNYAIYNLGGGTFDISIIKVEGQNINVIASDGVGKLGGDDFDTILKKIVKDKLKKEHDEDLDEQDYTKTDAEKDKKSLSKRENINVRINKKNIKVTRAEFEKEISSLVAQTEMSCEYILNENNLTTSDIQDVFLVGGNTRIPSVEDTVKRVFGKTPVKSINVNEVVVLGASLYAAYKGDQSTPPSPPDPAPTPVQQASVIDSEDDYSKIDKFLVD